MNIENLVEIIKRTKEKNRALINATLTFTSDEGKVIETITAHKIDHVQITGNRLYILADSFSIVAL